MICRIHRPLLPRSLRLLVLALPTGLSLGTARLARAEEPEAKPANSVAASPVALGTPSSEPDEPLARARAVVALAEPLFLAGHYAAALAEYSRAYQILEGHPRQYWVLHNQAACNERMFRYDVAVELYEEYLRRAPPTEGDRREVSAILTTLRSLLATLVIESSVTGEVWLDDRRLGGTPGKWRIPAGRHIVEVRADRYESQRREVQLNAGQVQVDRFYLQRLSTYAGPPPAYFWVAVGLTAAATATGVTAGVMALSAREQGLQRAELHLDTSADAERTNHRALASDIGFGAAALFGVTATVLYFVTDWPKSGNPGGRGREPSARRSLSLALAAPGGFGATLNGKF
jgi:tetratricopeptide (TPR) repeat protein